MPASDAFAEARDELYGLDPEQFLSRRAELAAAARGDDPLAAKRIAALRKPTRSAHVLNRLVRDAAGVIDRLESLAAELRHAQASLDGARIRDVSERRNKLVGELARDALRAAGVRNAAVGMRDEIAGTLSAALADPDVLDQLRDGALVRAARWDGFGDAGPALSLVPPTPLRAPAEPVAEAEAAPTRATQRRKERLAELVERRDEAQAAVDAADRTVADRQHEARLAEQQLTEARRALDDALVDARMAQRRLDTAQAALDKATD